MDIVKIEAHFTTAVNLATSAKNMAGFGENENAKILIEMAADIFSKGYVAAAENKCFDALRDKIDFASSAFDRAKSAIERG